MNTNVRGQITEQDCKCEGSRRGQESQCEERAEDRNLNVIGKS
jgi:hypothetical protein